MLQVRGALEPEGQKLPIGQSRRVAGVGHTDPMGHVLDTLRGSGDLCNASSLPPSAIAQECDLWSRVHSNKPGILIIQFQQGRSWPWVSAGHLEANFGTQATN